MSKLTVLTISMDRKIFDLSSAAAKRQVAYGTVASELHIVVFTKQVDNYQVIKLAANVTVYPTKSSSRWSYIGDAIRVGRKVMAEHTIDLISASDASECGWAGYRLSLRSDTPLQLQVHTDIFSPNFAASGWLNWFRVQMAKWLLPKASGIRAVSDRVRFNLVKHLGPWIANKIIVLPIFVDGAIPIAQTTTKLFPQFETVVLIVSRLEPEKDCLTAIKVFNQVVKKFPNVGVVIVGDGSERGKLEQYVAEHNLISRVIFAGWQSNLTPYYQRADIFMATSLYEGYGMSLVEAAKAGLAIITTPVGVVGYELPLEVVKVCPIGDMTSIREALESLLADKSLAASLGTAARHAIIGQVASLDEYLTQYGEAWQKLCSKP